MMSRVVILSGASFPSGALICLLLYSGDALSAQLSAITSRAQTFFFIVGWVM